METDIYRVRLASTAGELEKICNRQADYGYFLVSIILDEDKQFVAVFQNVQYTAGLRNV